MNIKKIQKNRRRRAFRVRQTLRSVSKLPRVSVFRSHKHIYAQLIDDVVGQTLVASSSQELNINAKEQKLDKKGVAKVVGMDLAQKAIQKNITTACFDRGRYLYHGRVKSLADGLREAGLKI